jgi:hypothetical protein
MLTVVRGAWKACDGPTVGPAAARAANNNARRKRRFTTPVCHDVRPAAKNDCEFRGGRGAPRSPANIHISRDLTSNNHPRIGGAGARVDSARDQTIGSRSCPLDRACRPRVRRRQLRGAGSNLAVECARGRRHLSNARHPDCRSQYLRRGDRPGQSDHRESHRRRLRHQPGPCRLDLSRHHRHAWTIHDTARELSLS